MNLPSIRECLEQWRAMAAAPQAGQLEALHQLAGHMATYLSHGGTVVKPPPAPPPKIPAVSALKNTPPITVPSKAPSPPVPQMPVPDGLVTREELLRELGYSNPWLSIAMRDGKVPYPTEQHGRLRMWRRSVIDPVIARLRKPQGAA